MKSTKSNRSKSIPTNTQTTEPSVADALTAFESTRAERDALTADRLVPTNLDVGAGALTAIAAVRRLAPFLLAICAKGPEVAAAIRNLLTYAHAAFYANYVYQHASPSTEEFQRLLATLVKQRTRAFGVLQMCVAFGILDESVLAGLREGSGHRDTLEDVGAAEQLIRERWASLEGTKLLTIADLDEMRATTVKFATVLAEKESVATVATEAANDRQRAFTLLARAYDQVRRALTYIRWEEGDADEIAPSLWVRPGGGRRTSSDVARPAEPVATPTVAPKPAAPALATAVTNNNPYGPNGSPFTS